MLLNETVRLEEIDNKSVIEGKAKANKKKRKEIKERKMEAMRNRENEDDEKQRSWEK